MTAIMLFTLTSDMIFSHRQTRPNSPPRAFSVGDVAEHPATFFWKTWSTTNVINTNVLWSAVTIFVLQSVQTSIIAKPIIFRFVTVISCAPVAMYSKETSNAAARPALRVVDPCFHVVRSRATSPSNSVLANSPPDHFVLFVVDQC
jgi:hypothetical protein